MTGGNEKPHPSNREGETFATILIGTSLAPESAQVLRTALAVARALGARIRLLHTLPLKPIMYGFDGVVPPSVVETLQEQSEADLASQIQETGILDHELISADVVAGAPHQVLVSVAQDTNVDLVIVGASEAPGHPHRLLGSTADRVIRSAHCPVLILRRGMPLAPARVFAPVDLSSTSALAVRTGIRFLRQLGSDQSAELEILFVLSPFQREVAAQSSPQQMDRLAKKELLRFTSNHAEGWNGTIKTTVRAGDPRHQLLKVLEEHPADLTIVGSHGHGRLHRALIGSVAAGISRRASCSVLFVPF